MLGHDKFIFKQYQFINKGWVSNESTCKILPKDEGMGVMISAFKAKSWVLGHQ